MYLCSISSSDRGWAKVRSATRLHTFWIMRRGQLGGGQPTTTRGRFKVPRKSVGSFYPQDAEVIPWSLVAPSVESSRATRTYPVEFGRSYK
jgi:hypothetical protein